LVSWFGNSEDTILKNYCKLSVELFRQTLDVQPSN